MFFFHLIGRGDGANFLNNESKPMKYQIYSSIGFLIKAEGVLSVLMQTAYSYGDAVQFRNKRAFAIYFSMYQD